MSFQKNYSTFFIFHVTIAPRGNVFSKGKPPPQVGGGWEERFPGEIDNYNKLFYLQQP